MVMLIGPVLIIALIIFATTKLGLHPFLTLIGAGVLTGLIGGLGTNSIVSKSANGFGRTLKSIGIVIAFGTIIGAFPELRGGGNAWPFLSKADETDTGKNKSKPHRLIKLKDGSLVVNYDYRAVPYGIRAKIKQHISATIRDQNIIN